MTSRSTSHIRAQRLAIRSDVAVQELGHQLDAKYQQIIDKINTISPPDLPQPSPYAIEQQNSPSLLQTVAVPAKLAKRLQILFLPVSISARSFTSMRMMNIVLSIRRGQVVIEKWTTSGEIIYEVLRSEPSYGIEISMQATRILPLRMSLVLFLTTRLWARWSLSTTIQVKHHRIVPLDAEIAVAVRTGNVAHITKLFSDGQARPTDVLLNGHSLIHVSQSTYSGFCLIDVSR